MNTTYIFLARCCKNREFEQRIQTGSKTAERLDAANQVPFVRLVVKEDEEDEEEAREEVKEKRRVTCVSLGAGSIAGEGSRRDAVRNQQGATEQVKHSGWREGVKKQGWIHGEMSHYTNKENKK